MKFIKGDSNYFHKGTSAKDCVFRALSIATLYGYKYLCDLFGKGDDFKLGIGYNGNQGVSREEIDNFADETGIIEKIWGDESYSDMLGELGTTDDDTLESFLNYYIDDILEENGINKKTARLFVTVRTPNTKKTDTHHFHATPILWSGNDWLCVDVETIKNIEYSIPIYVYVVREMADKNSPNFCDNEKKTMLAKYEKLMSELGKLFKK